ncbi:MAG: DUF2393 domain-containing protein [Thiovulaceae bacterium]|nr:DUF2393 domain-containing protein [Sulfurimonadaceae bacterium]
MNVQGRINSVVDSLIVQDYILFGSVFILFLLFMILAIILRNKKKTSVLLVILALSVFFLGPTVGFVQMHKFLFKNEVQLVSEKKLEFTKAIVIQGLIKNLSNKNLNECKIIATAYKKTSNEFKNYIFRLKPIQKSSIVEVDLKIGQSKDFKMFIEPFVYNKDYEVGLEASCR